MPHQQLAFPHIIIDELAVNLDIRFVVAQAEVLRSALQLVLHIAHLLHYVRNVFVVHVVPLTQFHETGFL